MVDPKVSIIIPTYNQASFIAKAIESCLCQTYLNLEIIIADDCSDDQTREIVVKYLADERVKYFTTSENAGRTANYKNALEHCATGEWVVNLDGDDYYDDPTFVEDFINYYNNAGNSAIVLLQAGHKEYLLDEKNIINVAVPNIGGMVEVMNGKKYFLNFFTIAQFSHLATMFKRELAVSIDFYRCDILSSDVESILRLALHGDVMLIKRTVGVWVKHRTNASSTASLRRAAENIGMVKSCYDYAQNFGFLRMDIRDWKNHMDAIFFIAFLRNAKRKMSVFLTLTDMLFVMKIFFIKSPTLILNKYLWTSLFASTT